MVEFLKLLEDYRLKCQESSLYLQAEKVNQKIVQVKDKEMRRHKLNLIMDQRSRVITVNSLQQSKMVDFNTAWD